MSSSSGLARGRRRILMAAAGLMLAGCGFRPLYGTREADGSSTVADLELVSITPLQDRTGQQFHNLLRNRINPRGQPVQPRHRLNVTLRESVRELALRSDETATRADLSLFADYSLVSTADNSVVFRGSSRTINSYNILTSAFATQVSEQDARERGLRELSDEIRAQLGIYFSRVAE